MIGADKSENVTNRKSKPSNDDLSDSTDSFDVADSPKLIGYAKYINADEIRLDSLCESHASDRYDFHALLKSLTADFDREEEIQEFNDLAKQIEKMNINLTEEQIQEILESEKEMNEIIGKIKGLDLNVINEEHDKEVVKILKRLTDLTLSGDVEDEEEFDVLSESGSDEDEEYECKYVDNNENRTRSILGRQIDPEENIQDMTDTRLKDKKQSKLKRKSVVYKCTKFMLKILMVGAPLLYYFIN